MADTYFKKLQSKHMDSKKYYPNGISGGARLPIFKLEADAELLKPIGIGRNYTNFLNSSEGLSEKTDAFRVAMILFLTRSRHSFAKLFRKTLNSFMNYDELDDESRIECLFYLRPWLVKDKFYQDCKRFMLYRSIFEISKDLLSHFESGDDQVFKDYTNGQELVKTLREYLKDKPDYQDFFFVLPNGELSHLNFWFDFKLENPQSLMLHPLFLKKRMANADKKQKKFIFSDICHIHDYDKFFK